MPLAFRKPVSDKTNNLKTEVARARAWHKPSLPNIMGAYINLRNMTIEDERAAYPSRIAAEDDYDTSNSYSVTRSYMHGEVMSIDLV